MLQHKLHHYFLQGCKALLPLATGVVPFGMIMGTVSAESGLTLIESLGLNLIVFAGASQLVAVELMNNNTPAVMVILTCIIINLRLLMYSTALAPIMNNVSLGRRLGLAYLITDQAYAVSALGFEKLTNIKQKIAFYFGAGFTLFAIWQISVLIGLFFGDIAPPSLSLDFGVPLAFMSVLVPSIKNKKVIIVALASAFLSVIFYQLPFKLGLVVSALLSLVIAFYFEKSTEAHRG